MKTNIETKLQLLCPDDISLAHGEDTVDALHDLSYPRPPGPTDFNTGSLFSLVSFEEGRPAMGAPDDDGWRGKN